MTTSRNITALYRILDEIGVYRRSMEKLSFDMQCCAPEDGMAQAGEDIAVLGKRVYSLTHSTKYRELLLALHDSPDELTHIQKKLVEHLYDSYMREKNITAAFSFKLDSAKNRAYSQWLAAKKSGDYSIFRDNFRDVVELTRRSIELRDTKYPSYYDACLDDYEKGSSCVFLDEFFSAVKARVIPLLKRIERSGRVIRDDFLSRPCPISKQEEFSKYLLDIEGLKPSALVLMTTEHPFTTNFGPKDVRVTTHYYEENFVSNIFTTLHEGGHALFMQNEPEELVKNHADNAMSDAMHECISRFYENLIGRSAGFIHFIYPKFLELGGGAFDDVSEKELYEAVNIARPGLIRMEADELTYSLHILVRYELEKAFINGDISVDDVPRLWNEKYHEYLGIDVPNDTLGCLQDVHWTDSYGYFPSYALGNAYGAQIYRRMNQDFDVDKAVSEGKLNRVLSWLTERVFNCASIMDPDEWIRSITGESLNVNYYLDYLENKFTRLYGLE